MAEATPAIELRHATKRYGETVALNDVSMVIEPGEFFCLLGPSGCGKTTTLNLIGGFIPLTSGELLVEGRTVSDLPPHKRNVNTVFQNYALFPHMSVAKNIAFGLRMERLSSAEIASRTAEYLELVALERYGSRMPSELSGGQQQRVALARALAKRPAVLLLDEPLGALDLKLRKQMQTELSRIHRQVGTTFVFVTHDQEEALSMATRIAIMSGGEVVQLGTPVEVYDRPVNRFVANFVGETNSFSGDVRTSGGRAMFEFDGGGAVEAPSGADEGPATMMVRPEFLGLRAPAAVAATPGIPGRVSNISFLGNYTRITVTTGAGDVVVVRPHGTSEPTDVQRGLGEEVCVWWLPEHATLIRD
ncbi:MAG: spermidine/putrescine transport system ATP-binding protein [Chloroflexota bacterium]|nr:spermidine/putrescine transport system ATP-binding protein [Chloroflexota bacterium]